MKKIVSFVLIAFSLVILVNCSPKTSKSTASYGNRTRESTQSNISPTGTNTSSISSSSSSSSSSNSSINSSSSTANAALNTYLTQTKDRVDKGKMLFETNCQKCHELYSPSSRTSFSWVDIMKAMAPKANLGSEHASMVTAYLVQNARK